MWVSFFCTGFSAGCAFSLFIGFLVSKAERRWPDV